jgi:hypothetical protein
VVFHTYGFEREAKLEKIADIESLRGFTIAARIFVAPESCDIRKNSPPSTGNIFIGIPNTK